MYHIAFYTDLEDQEDFELASWSSEVPFLLNVGEEINFSFESDWESLPEKLQSNARERLETFQKNFNSWDKFEIIERNQYVKSREFLAPNNSPNPVPIATLYRWKTDITLEYFVKLKEKE